MPLLRSKATSSLKNEAISIFLQAQCNFIDDLLTMGGPEKEFVFREKIYFLETVFDLERSMKKLYLD